jgi:hypothetical protein
LKVGDIHSHFGRKISGSSMQPHPYKSSDSATTPPGIITDVDCDTCAIVEAIANDRNNVEHIDIVRNVIGFAKACIRDCPMKM